MTLFSIPCSARKHLNYLIHDIGSRPFGTKQNTNATLNYLVGEVERIIREAGSGKLSYYVDVRPGYVVEDRKDGSVLRLWNRMQNVVVTVKGRGNAEVHKNALLLSAHYDTVTLSPGATDNTLSVACLLESLEVLAHAAQSERDVIVAFVNGEESGLLGAEHMTTDELTFPTVGTFINLDGTPGDKSMMFRSTGGWMDFLYGAAPRPLGFVVAEDIFNLGVVSSDTDWSVYQRSRQGLDWATFAHRQTYHTMKDTKIASGAMQYLGENILGVVLKVADLRTNDPLEKSAEPREKHVFWSFLNTGWAAYSMTAALVIHITIAIVLTLSIIFIAIHRTVRWKDAFQFAAAPPLRILGVGFVICFGTLFVTVGCSLLCAVFVQYQAPWFAWSNTPMGVWAFVLPSVAAFLGAQWVITLIERKYNIVIEISRLHVLWGHATLVAVLLWATVYFTKAHVGSTYLLYLSFCLVPVQLIIQHLFYLFGYMSDDKSEYIPLSNEENMSLLTSNTMGYGLTHSTYDEEQHARTHAPKVDSKTTHFIWFIIFLLGTLPLIFISDLLPVLFDFASSTVPSTVFGLVIGLIVYVFAVNLMPLTRRGGHLGVLALIVLIAALACFFSFTMVNRNNFTDKSPFVALPESVDGVLKVTALEQAFTPSVASVFNKIGATAVGGGTCSHDSCQALPVALMETFTLAGQVEANGNRTLIFTAANAQYFSIDLVGPVSDFILKHDNVTTTWTIASGKAVSVEVLLIDPDQNSWSLTFDGPAGTYKALAGWTDSSVLTGFDNIKNAVQASGWVTFMGDGTGLHWKSNSVVIN